MTEATQGLGRLAQAQEAEEGDALRSTPLRHKLLHF